MLKKLTNVSIFVKDQNEALRFYTEALGLEIRTDMSTPDGFRWLTVGAKTQPDLNIILMALKPYGHMTEEGMRMLGALQDSGQLSGGVWETDDCRQTYEELRAKGVEFVSPPTDMPYGIEAVWKDNSGNWFTLMQRKY
jgi:predicted enzyme related to lactoylglutathione lyase